VSLLRNQAERAIASVVEAECPLCKVELRVHNGRACCPCCGDSYIAATDRLEIRPCLEHSRRCEHWEVIRAAPGEVAER
jgi:uncharacterized Zn finger protein (UPF0148 family)